MNIKYIGSDTKVSEKGKVHVDAGGGKTACGKTYSDNTQDWEKTSETVTCNLPACSGK